MKSYWSFLKQKEKEKKIYMLNGISFSHKEELNYAFCREMDETGNNYVKQNKEDLQRQISHVSPHM
jgi:hypothetical protein